MNKLRLKIIIDDIYQILGAYGEDREDIKSDFRKLCHSLEQLTQEGKEPKEDEIFKIASEFAKETNRVYIAERLEKLLKSPTCIKEPNVSAEEWIKKKAMNNPVVFHKEHGSLDFKYQKKWHKLMEEYESKIIPSDGEIEHEAENFADSQARRGTAGWKGLYQGYIKGKTNKL